MTIVAWDYIIDWLTYRFPRLRPVFRPPALTVIRDGRVIEQAMQKELLSMDDLLAQLRQQQIETVEEVKVARLEGDGRFSAIRRD